MPKLFFWKTPCFELLTNECFGRHRYRSLVVTLAWVFVIHHTIFEMRPVYFWCIENEVKYWWFDNFTRFNTNIIYWINMSLFVITLIYSLNITHNYLCYLCDTFNCWLLCEVTVEEVIVYSLHWQYLIYRMHFRTFVNTVEEKVHSHIA